MCVRVVTVMQARSSSTRLPGKVLRPVLGIPVLLQQARRMERAGLLGTLVVATSTDPADDELVDIVEADGIPVVRGSLDDLLDRHLVAGREFDADAVVKIPSDCPLIDPAIIDLVLGSFLESGADFTSNLHPPSWPDGHDVEIVRMEVLEEAGREATKDFEREHTTPFVWERPDRYRVENLTWDRGEDFSMSHRWTIDYPEDLAFVTAVYEAFGDADDPSPTFGLDDVLDLLDARPDVAAINARYAGVNWYRHHLDDLATVHSDATRFAPEERA
ncbi:MAG: glycosyltransferase family protein [Acidimicrobiia bacterium]|nr:glycosyltransferase family protein [Acidimicrobiia bacterium]